MIELYEKLSSAPDDKTRARIIAEAFEAFEALEERYPNLSEVATRQDVRESELRLRKEIEQVRADLSKKIEQVRAEARQIEFRLQKEIDHLVRLEVKNVEVRLTQAIHRQTLWVIGSVGALIGFIRLLEWLLARLG